MNSFHTFPSPPFLLCFSLVPLWKNIPLESLQAHWACSLTDPSFSFFWFRIRTQVCKDTSAHSHTVTQQWPPHGPWQMAAGAAVVEQGGRLMGTAHHPSTDWGHFRGPKYSDFTETVVYFSTLYPTMNLKCSCCKIAWVRQSEVVKQIFSFCFIMTVTIYFSITKPLKIS